MDGDSLGFGSTSTDSSEPGEATTTPPPPPPSVREGVVAEVVRFARRASECSWAEAGEECGVRVAAGRGGTVACGGCGGGGVAAACDSLSCSRRLEE